ASPLSVAASAATPPDPPATPDTDDGHHALRPHGRSSTAPDQAALRSPGATRRPRDLEKSLHARPAIAATMNAPAPASAPASTATQNGEPHAANAAPPATTSTAAPPPQPAARSAPARNASTRPRQHLQVNRTRSTGLLR